MGARMLVLQQQNIICSCGQTLHVQLSASKGGRSEKDADGADEVASVMLT